MTLDSRQYSSRDHADATAAVNKNIFPVDVETYPHTRGIRAELAATIFIFVLGLVSQSKMWRIVRERRRRKSAEQKERERDANALEEAVGRKVEDDINRERAEWEAIYDGRSPSVDTRCGSVGDGGAESEGKLGPTVVELRDLGGQTPDATDGGDVLRQPSLRGGVHSTGGPQAEATRSSLPTVRGISDGAEGVGSDGLPRRWSLNRTASGVKPTQPGTPSDSPGPGVNSGGSARSSVHVPGLPITPLPFNIPDSTPTPNEDDGTSSVSACAESTPGLVQIVEHPVLSRLRMSSAGYSHVLSSSEEALLPPRRNDGEDSSVAATVDEGSDLDSTPPLPLPPLPSATEGASAPLSHVRLGLEPAAAVPLPSSPTPGSEFDRLEDNPTGSNRHSVLVPRSRADGLNDAFTPADAEAKRASSIRLSQAVLNDQSPNQVSRVLSCYRTNEWAKHLSLADTPDLDYLEPTEDAVVVVESSADTPVEAGGHSARAEPEPPAETVVGESRALPTKDVRLAAVTSSLAATASKEGLPLLQTANQAPAAGNRPRAQSVASFDDRRSSSTSSSSVRSLVMADAPSARPVRSSSNPVFRQSASSSATRLSVYRNMSRSSQVSLPAENTLISQRESLIYNKYGTRSSSQLTPVPELDAHVTPGSSTPVVDDAGVPAAGGDGPLANEQTELVQRQLSQQRERFNLYQPKRYSDLEGQRRNAMLAQWRQSLRDHSINSRQPDQQLEEARASDLHVDRQHKLHNTRHQSVAVAGADVLVDERMRRPDMLELHRIAMKRMQSGARVHSGQRY